ncbi:hypothetical protein [Aestuariivirga sp.]|uniref:hypothetical protein n=1 Tax=Aestuariivirga sp. TaxID=2650926 RepID=UPI00391D30D2
MRFHSAGLLVLAALAGCFWPQKQAGAAAGGPQLLVVCTGWHALCSASPDCRIKGAKAECDCLRVNETHIVETSEIQDDGVKRITMERCTDETPCAVDEAPVCEAIRSGNYEVENIRYEWVSTYSYRGWCGLLQPPPVPCDPAAAGYTGDRQWAICDAAPCTELADPPDPERPLRCQCRVMLTSFVGANGTCTGRDGGIMSSFPVEAWDFGKNTYPETMPGYEYVQAACAPLKSDPPPP